MSINTTQGPISFFFGGRVTCWLILSLQWNKIFMPFPQMVLGHHCLFVSSFCSLFFEFWLNFILFCTIQCSGLLAFHLLLPFTVRTFLSASWSAHVMTMNLIFLPMLLHRRHSVLHHRTSLFRLTVTQESYLRVTLLVADSPKYPSIWFTSL